MSNLTLIIPELRRVEAVHAGTLALFRFAEMTPFTGIASLVDWRLLGHLSNLIIEGFFTGTPDETLLMPLGHRLAQDCLLLFGMGERRMFCQETFEQQIIRLFDTTDKLGRRDVVMAMPGRLEHACETAEAIEWFLTCREAAGWDQNIFVVEPFEEQKAMLPVIERWRLKRLVP